MLLNLMQMHGRTCLLLGSLTSAFFKQRRRNVSDGEEIRKDKGVCV